MRSSWSCSFRYLGLRGHQALIRKATNDDSQNDIWKHMEKIIPSIIFNMKLGELDSVASSIEDPSILADSILRDLLNRAYLNIINLCIQPILTYDGNVRLGTCFAFRYLDDHQQWIPDDFPRYILTIVMTSIRVGNGEASSAVRPLNSCLASQ